MKRAYRLLNVFTVPGDRLSGNPLCVFEAGEGLTDAQMQALARQFNLSETTFVLPPTTAGATARVRIFTPTFEMPFAGHPTLGTAQVVGALHGLDAVALEMKAGLVEVRREDARWTLRTAKAPTSRVPEASAADLVQMLGLAEGEVGPPLWVNTGVEQLVVPLKSGAAVARARPNSELLARFGHSVARAERMAYIWAPTADGRIDARFFFLQDGALIEDPATGSACANLGGYLLATQHALPVHWQVSQGSAVGRPSRLHLTVDADRQIFVGGAVVELGSGTLEL